MRQSLPRQLLRAFWANRLCFLPAVAALGVEAIRTTLYRLTVSCRPVLGFSLPSCEPATITFVDRIEPGFPARLALNGRFLWFSVLVLLVSVAAAVIAVGVAAAIRALAGLGRRERIAAIGLVAIAIVSAAVLSFLKAKTFLLVEQILSPTGGPFPASVAHFLQTVASIARSATFAAAASLVAVACTTLGSPSVTAHAAQTERQLRSQVERLQVVLYIGGALLVLAVLEFQLFFDWILLAFSIGQQNALRPLIAATLAGNGAVYSLFLAAVYVPASLVLRHRTTQLSYEVAPELDVVGRSRWLEERGLAPTWMRTVSRATVVLAPYLASTPLSVLVKVIQEL